MLDMERPYVLEETKAEWYMKERFADEFRTLERKQSLHGQNAFESLSSVLSF